MTIIVITYSEAKPSIPGARSLYIHIVHIVHSPNLVNVHCASATWVWPTMRAREEQLPMAASLPPRESSSSPQRRRAPPRHVGSPPALHVGGQESIEYHRPWFVEVHVHDAHV